MAPTISIVITVYNRPDWLPQAIKSVLQQTYPDFELLVWDDGSTDDSVAVARRYESDPRVRVIAAEHLGHVKAMRAAMAQTRGRYLAYVDSDDYLAPDALKETAAVLDAQPDVGLVYTHYINVDESGKSQGVGGRCKIPYSKDRMLLDFVTFHFRLMRRTVYEAVGGFDDSMPCAADYDLCLKLSEATKVVCVPKPLYYYRRHANSVSQGRRLEQIEASKNAIERAIVRRGLADRYELKVEIVGRFMLKRKPPASAKMPVPRA